jgi:alcohol dehydrogenase (cytochrome c)
MVIGNNIIVGIGGDSLDVPGYLEARDPETGDLKWRWNTTPRKGEANLDSWPSEEASAHGGGMTWVPGTYDPELNLLYWPTGNPQPVLSGRSRPGDNLYTCSLVALNPDTGKMVWYFQFSPHDTHDWDSNQTRIMFDGEFNGQPRKLIAQANRNGYFFVLDRKTGEHLLTKPFANLNWSKGVRPSGSPEPDPEKEPQTDGTLVAPASGGAANWPPPSYNPETGLFYVDSTNSFSIFYLTDTSDKPQGWAGRDSGLYSQEVLKAIDYKTGEIRWSHTYHGRGSGSSGILNTAGKLLFSGDSNSNFIARNPATGEILWHTRLHASVANGPMTYELDGRQYVVVGGGDSLYAFTVLE